MITDDTQPPTGAAPVSFRYDYGLDGTPMARGELQAVTYCAPGSKRSIAATGQVPREVFNAYIWPMLMDLARAEFTQHGYCIHYR